MRDRRDQLGWLERRGQWDNPVLMDTQGHKVWSVLPVLLDRRDRRDRSDPKAQLEVVLAAILARPVCRFALQPHNDL